MNRALPLDYQEHLTSKDGTRLAGGLTIRALWTGAFLSFFLAAGAPYANMVMHTTLLAFDFSAPGATILFLLLIGLLNTLFKVAARCRGASLGLAAVSVAAFGSYYWPLGSLDPHSPGTQLNTFLVSSAVLNAVATRRGRSLALNRSELVLVYVMLLIVSALCTMGMSQQLLPTLTALFYYASPENDWLEKLLPHLPELAIVVNDGDGNRVFYEGVVGGSEIPYGAWVEPLIWWAVFLLALYAAMICVAVILRRQWMERERLPYPLSQVGLAMVAGESEGGLVNSMFRRRSLWIGCAIPLIVGAMRGASRYTTAVPNVDPSLTVSMFGQFDVSIIAYFSLIGFSYFINTQVAAGIWVFYLLARCQKVLMNLTQLSPDQTIVYGVTSVPLLAYQGVGALLAMVLIGFWIGRQHLRDVALKALGRAGPEVDDSDEILSYRAAVFGTAGGTAVMVGWLWLMGTKLWVCTALVILALLIFVGITRILAEAGLAAMRAPMIAPDLLMLGAGSTLVGATGVFNLSMAYIWCSDIRVFIMGMAANGLKLIETMDLASRKTVFWAIVLAIFIGAVGSCWTVFHLAHTHGGVSVDNWFFKGAPSVVFDTAARNLEPTGVHWSGMGFLFGGGLLMALMMWVRHRVPWWPVHPIGFPIGANFMMERVWGSVFIAWVVKVLVLRFAGAAAYRSSQFFFLGLIVGEATAVGLWLVVDYITGMMNNRIFHIG